MTKTKPKTDWKSNKQPPNGTEGKQQRFTQIRKSIYVVFLDDTMYVMHQKGLKSTGWDLVKGMNENLSAQLSTRQVNTGRIRMKYSIKQGEVSSSLQYRRI